MLYSAPHMRNTLMALALAAATLDAAAAPPSAKPAPGADIIEMHLGVPGKVYLGQPLSEFLGRFPKASKSPFAGQDDVIRLQLPAEGMSVLAMGQTPATMTVESIGFTFGEAYEGVAGGKRRTREGIGDGSTVNDLLAAYGRPAESFPEKTPGSLSPQSGKIDPNAPMRYLYRNEDRSVTTYFIVQGSQVLRMVTSRPALIDRFVLKRPLQEAPQGQPAQPPPSKP
jgi:hypothetical protein